MRYFDGAGVDRSSKPQTKGVDGGQKKLQAFDVMLPFILMHSMEMPLGILKQLCCKHGT